MYFSDYIGMQGDDGESDVAYIQIEDHHTNPTGNINGGVIISLADNLATGAANRAYGAKFNEAAFLVGVDLHVVMLANQIGGTITARSEPVRVGRRITVIRTSVTGDNDRLLAEVTTTHVPTPAPESQS